MCFAGAIAAAKGVGPVSVLKPVRGLDPGFREAIRSHTVLQGEYEFLCGVSQPNDPGLAVLREFYRVRVVDCGTHTANGKVGVLMDLAAAAKNPILVVNDADIRVEPDYLTRVTAPLADPRVGLVTCLYRPLGDTFAARFEGLGVATDFAPSALVARLVGVDEFAMGSTLAFRREDLERIGGFAAVADYLADDYQLGHRIHALGLKCVLSDVVVETHLGGGWRQVWAHQVRWARTIRVSRFGGYLGLPITNATLWAVVCALFRALGSGGGAAGSPAGDGVRGGMAGAAQPRRAVPMVAGAGAGSVRIRGVGGGAVRPFSDVARAAVGAGSRRANSSRLRRDHGRIDFSPTPLRP